MDVAAGSFDAKGNSQMKFSCAVWYDCEIFCIDMRNLPGPVNLAELEGFRIETTDI